MELNLRDKTVIVTAASKGLGKAAAKAFAAEGANVIISSRNEEELIRTAQEIVDQTGQLVHPIVCDMTKPEDIQKLVQKSVDLFGKIHILINNTGGPPSGGFDLMDDAAWQSGFELSLLSFIRTIRAVLPYMKEQKQGHIVNFASSSIKQPVDNLILSNTFRTGLVGLSKSLARELAPDNILINTIGPGRIATDRVAELDQFKANRLHLTFDEVRANEISQIPMGRYGTPDEFAKLVVFLCSGVNTYITGQSILVDGGYVRSL
jgi:3-oxoacyl-[acyl-carrier protein] reductase